MFWIKRLKAEDTQTSWLVPYGDLMSLLLAIFVMVAAMSELRAGDRFDQVRSAVRSAFGFAEAAPSTGAEADMPTVPVRRLTLLERLERAGFARQSKVHLLGPDDEVLAPCDVLLDRDQVIVRIAGQMAFQQFSAALEPTAERAIDRIAGFLVGGHDRIELRGHSGDGMLPAGAPFRDALDLSYARARAVAEVLVRRGVQRERIRLTAWGDGDPLETAGGVSSQESSAVTASVQPRALPDGADRRIEIVVHADLTAQHDQDIAEKDGVDNG